MISLSAIKFLAVGVIAIALFFVWASIDWKKAKTDWKKAKK